MGRTGAITSIVGAFRHRAVHMLALCSRKRRGVFAAPLIMACRGRRNGMAQHGIPIDYDEAMCSEAERAAGGTTEALFAAYFDHQYELITALQPQVIGHFDVIRLFRRDFDMTVSPAVWQRGT